MSKEVMTFRFTFPSYGFGLLKENMTTQICYQILNGDCKISDYDYDNSIVIYSIDNTIYEEKLNEVIQIEYLLTKISNQNNEITRLNEKINSIDKNVLLFSDHNLKQLKPMKLKDNEDQKQQNQ